MNQQVNGCNTLGNNRSKCSTGYAHFRKSEFSKNQHIIKNDINESCNKCRYSEHFGLRNSYKKTPEVYIDEGKKETEDTPVEIF